MEIIDYERVMNGCLTDIMDVSICQLFILILVQ